MNAEADIISIVEANMALAFESDEQLERYLSAIETANKPASGNVMNDAGRKEIASAAYSIARKKTALDEAGKSVKDDAQKRVNAVNEMRRKAKERLEELQAAIRAPLTKWEEQEKARVASCKAIVDKIKESGVVTIDDTSSSVDERIKWLEGVEIATSDFQDMADFAFERRVEALLSLRNAHAALLKKEAEQAELERLRREQAERDAAEQDRIAQERAAREAEESRLRIEREKVAAAEKAKADAEARAAAEIAEKERAHQAELARIKAEADRAEKERADAEKRAAAEQAARDEADRIRREDEAHRSAVMRSAKEALMEQGPLDEGTAKKIISAIAKGTVPNVTINF